MKKIFNHLKTKKYIFERLETIDKKEIKTRKKIDFYRAVDLKKNYHLIMYINQKSRFLLKGAMELDELVRKIIVCKNHNFRFVHVIRDYPTCNKAIEYIKSNEWKYHGTV